MPSENVQSGLCSRRGCWSGSNGLDDVQPKLVKRLYNHSRGLEEPEHLCKAFIL